jgi:hypothetical protein
MRLCAAFAHYPRMGQGTQILICFVLLVAVYFFILWRLNEQQKPPRAWPTNGHDRAARREIEWHPNTREWMDQKNIEQTSRDGPLTG